MTRLSLPLPLILVLCTACTVASPAPPVQAPVPMTASTPTVPQPPAPVASPTTRLDIQSRVKKPEKGSGIRIDIPANASPTTQDPTMELRLIIRDERSGQPVKGDVYLGGRLLKANVDTFIVTLDNEMDTQLTVRAPDYQAWSFQLRYRIVRDKVFIIPVNMKPLTSAAPPL